MTAPSIPGGTRRLSPEREVRITAADLGQPFDIDLSLPATERRPVAGLTKYYNLGLGAAVEGIARAAELGVPTVILRFVGKIKDRDAALAQQAQALVTLREQVGADALRYVVDPFNLALNDNLSWGVLDEDGQLRMPETIELLSAIARTFGQAGVDGLLTLGRIESEVEVTRRELDRVNPRTKIYSFSQNSETSTAYIYLDAGKAHDTGQKILPGNCTEMTLRALADIWDGTDVCVVKPIENFHLTLQLSELLDSEWARVRFLDSDRIARLAERSPYLEGKVAQMRSEVAAMTRKCANVLVGGYDVSGTSYALSLLEAQRGQSLARARLEEIWLNAAAASGTRRGPIIDRNAVPFLLGDGLC